MDSDGDGILDKIIDGEKRNLRLRLFVYEDPDNNVRFETANMIADMLEKLKIKVVITTMTFDGGAEEAAGELVRPGACVVPDGRGAGRRIFADERATPPTTAGMPPTR